MSNTPSDAEIIELMRDGYNCRYNDEADHIEFARAVLAKWAAPQPAPAPLSDDVVKDAARYRWLREGNDAKHGAAWHVAVNLYGCEWDAAIDAARARLGEKA